MRLGRPTALFEGLHPEVAAAVNAALAVFTKLTAGMREVELPASGTPAQVWGPESYLYHVPWFTKTPEKYQPATRRSLEGGAAVPAQTYVQARRQVDLLRREIRKVFANVELLIVPTSVNPPGKLGQGAGAPAGPGRNNNVPFDVFGLPAISVPCGFTSDGLPIGIQIIGAPFAEPAVFALAHAYEQATEWHKRHPEM
jgi:aspartyl-tRNA(Asn)/glutamyl-tRNA(Gln) amidotransferase subunit A